MEGGSWHEDLLRWGTETGGWTTLSWDLKAGHFKSSAPKFKAKIKLCVPLLSLATRPGGVAYQPADISKPPYKSTYLEHLPSVMRAAKSPGNSPQSKLKRTLPRPSSSIFRKVLMTESPRASKRWSSSSWQKSRARRWWLGMWRGRRCCMMLLYRRTRWWQRCLWSSLERRNWCLRTRMARRISVRQWCGRVVG